MDVAKYRHLNFREGVVLLSTDFANTCSLPRLDGLLSNRLDHCLRGFKIWGCSGALGGVGPALNVLAPRVLPLDVKGAIAKLGLRASTASSFHHNSCCIA